MTSPTHDKEWIEVERTKSVIWAKDDGTSEDNIFFHRSDTPNFNANIPESLLDQIRRDAYLEFANILLQECEKENMLLPKFKATLERAKTLGEK